MQRALIQYRSPKNYDLVHEALTKAGRTDLIGFDKKCLIRPRKETREGAAGHTAGKQEEYTVGKPAERAGKSIPGGKTVLRTGKTAGQNPQRKPKKKTIRNIHKRHSREQ